MQHDVARLRGEIRGGADQNHRSDALRLPSSHVEQHVTTAADTDSFTGTDAQVVEQSKNIRCSFLVAKGF